MHGMSAKSSLTTRTAFALGVVTFASPAYAYLDPGFASMVLSAIIGLFATAALAVKTYWYKLKRLFTKRGGETSLPEDDDAGST
jgi:hypothetical protein